MANKKISTINIKGKEYATVVARVNHFREETIYNDFAINTEVLHWDKGTDQIIIKASIYNTKTDDNYVIASGIAHEEKADRGVNATSYVENCETSAIGRALACLGIGTEDAYASSFEVEYAIDKQNNADKKPSLQNKMEAKLEYKLEDIITELNLSIFTDIAEEHREGVPNFMAMLANPNRTVNEVNQLHTFCKYYDHVDKPSKYANNNAELWKLSTENTTKVRDHITFLKSLFDNIPFELTDEEKFEKEVV